MDWLSKIGNVKVETDIKEKVNRIPENRKNKKIFNLSKYTLYLPEKN